MNTFTIDAEISPQGILSVTGEDLEDAATDALLPRPVSPESTTLPVSAPVPVRITVERI